MIEMKCCGVDDYEDFSKSDNWNLNRRNKTIPEACCHQIIRDGKSQPRDESCTTSPSASNSFYKKVKLWPWDKCFVINLSISGMLRSSYQLDFIESKPYRYGCYWNWDYWTSTDIFHMLSVQINRQISCYETLKYWIGQHLG